METIEAGRGRSPEPTVLRLKDWLGDEDVENGLGGVVAAEDGAELSLDEGSDVVVDDALSGARGRKNRGSGG